MRQVMRDVEEVARFLAPKYLSCYSDVLKEFLANEGRQDLVDELKDLNILLEFGVSQITQVSLMSLGLSRSTTVAVSERIAQDELTKNQALDWLKQNEWETMDLPELIKQEIRSVIAAHTA